MNAQDDRIYEVRIAGHLDDRWTTWFADLSIARCSDGSCTLTGEVADQAELYGILARLRDIGATLLSLRTLDGDALSVPSGVPARARGARLPGGC